MVKVDYQWLSRLQKVPIFVSLVPRLLSEKSRRGLATVPYNDLSRAVYTVRANEIAEFSYVTSLLMVRVTQERAKRLG